MSNGFRPGDKVRARYISTDMRWTGGVYPATVLQVDHGAYLVRWDSLETPSKFANKPSGVSWVDEDDVHRR
jgi:hypothetical protein